MSFDFPPQLADFVCRVVDEDFVVYDNGDNEVSRTTLANAIMQVDALYHFCREAARIDAQQQ